MMGDSMAKDTRLGDEGQGVDMSATQPRHFRGGSSGYHAVHQQDAADLDDDAEGLQPPVLLRSDGRRYRHVITFLVMCLVLLLFSNVYLGFSYFFPSYSDSGCGPKHVPQYFQTTPELWPGPTATGPAPFMAQTRVFEPTATYVPNEPLQTSIPIDGMEDGDLSIFEMMAQLTPYTPAKGWGVDEYPIPDGSRIVQVQMLSRHGARYPTSDSNVEALGKRMKGSSGQFRGSLRFLKDWEYHLGAEILVPRGRQELYDSGVLHNYMYGSLYNPNSKIIVRTTTQDRMLKSSENWVAGFFGLEWTNNATIEVIIESSGFNNSLAGSLGCPNAYVKSSEYEARDTWVDVYLKNATERFQAMTEDFDWTPSDVYAAQTMCSYETVAYGFSNFCHLFTYEEWQGFGYATDLAFSAGSGFHSPTGRAVGLGYQQEVIARLKNHTLGYSGSQINVTLDNNEETFPLNQSLYFDFSHDTNIVSILTAFGLHQFANDLPADKYPGEHAFTVSRVTPFGARLDMEIIQAPKPVSPNRDGYLRGSETKYIHFVLNQRTLPLGKSFPECGESRKDGWCELETFLKVQEEMVAKADFEYACFGDYDKIKYGDVTDGIPP